MLDHIGIDVSGRAVRDSLFAQAAVPLGIDPMRNGTAMPGFDGRARTVRRKPALWRNGVTLPAA
jgi:hypothetical protein